jgi:hypothetical protein
MRINDVQLSILGTELDETRGAVSSPVMTALSDWLKDLTIRLV